MIPRYSRAAMSRIWEDENRFAIWLEIETLAAEKMGQLGLVPRDLHHAMRKAGPVNKARIDAIEAKTRHDVIAFLTELREKVGSEDAHFIHHGMTSSDVLDTCLSTQLTQASDLLLEGLLRLSRGLRIQAFRHKHSIMMGRSHGVHAEPTSFGLVMAGFYAEAMRNTSRMHQARREIAQAAISGAVGTFAHLDPAVERHVAEGLGLSVEPISTQVIPRDRHAAFFSTLALVAAMVERLAIEIRHLQRSEVREAEEAFADGQKGSSAMPHKRNPILSENLTGLARLIRGYGATAMENVALWHERDISHSSVERVIAPDATILLDFALDRAASMVENLVVYPGRMVANLDSMGGLYHSQRILLALTKAGMAHNLAYSRVQACAMQVFQDVTMANSCNLQAVPSFRDRLTECAEITEALGIDTINALCDPSIHLHHIDTIFERVFGTTTDTTIKTGPESEARQSSDDV